MTAPTFTTPLPTVHDAIGTLLSILVTPDTDCALQPAPCRTAIYHGTFNELALDACSQVKNAEGVVSDGQLWANIGPVRVTNGGSGCESWTFTVDVGIVRCALVVDDRQAPDPDDLTTEAFALAVDADRIHKAITCCWPQLDQSNLSVRVLAWNSYGPTGGCAGGRWTMEVTADVCPCD